MMYFRAGRAVVLIGLMAMLSSCAIVKPESAVSEPEQAPAQPVSSEGQAPPAPVAAASDVKASVVEVIPVTPEPAAAVEEISPPPVAPIPAPVKVPVVQPPPAPVVIAKPEAEAVSSAAIEPVQHVAPNTFLITAATKDPSHLYYGVGSKMGFVVNGEQGKELILTRGETYTFKVDTDVKHDFYLSTSSRGWGAATLARGVKGNFTYRGIVTFTPDKNTPDVVFYQCRNHKNMGSKIHVINKGEQGKVVLGVRDRPGIAKKSTGRPSAFTTGTQAEQKIKFAEMFIALSPAAKRIEASDHAEAQQILAAAKVRLGDAKQAMAAGENEQAIAIVDEALRQMSVASQLVPSEAQLAELRSHYEELLKGAQTYEKSYRRNYKMMAKKGKKDLPGLDIDQVSATIADAAKLAGANRYTEANKLLARVQRNITGALTQLLADETMDYTLSFDTPKEEYEYELARYKSYEELVPIAIEQKQPARQTRALMEQFVKKGKSTYELSGPKAQQGDYKTAIQMLQGATHQIQRALRIVGVR